MMKNVLALSLVLTSLVSAGFFTPSPEKQHFKDDVRVKEAHMSSGVVIELEKDDGNTKVLISPQAQDHSHDREKGFVTNAKDKLSDETMEGKEEEEENHDHKFSPRELVCDAYGKCKHKIASAMGKTKDAAAAAEGAKDAVGETIGKFRNRVSDTAKKASDKAQETKESVKDKVKEKGSEMRQGWKEQVYNVKDKVYEVKEEAKKGMGEGIGKVKDTVSDAAAKKEASAQVGPKEKVKRQVSNVREKAKKAKEWMGTVTGVLHLVGLSAAYGMGVWVTFGSSYVLSGALPKQQFGMVQSKIYPVYFKAMAFSVGMGLLGHLMSGKRMVSPLSLAAALGMVLVNLLYLEPRATKVMFERMKKEKEEGRGKEGASGGRVVEAATESVDKGITTTEGATQEQQQPEKAGVIRGSREILRRLNSYSSVLNVLTLMSLTWHLLHLAHHLHTVC
ncbi:hypothetical protein BUALT_Bualt01G0002200 [Buddleja alternifolia]|uniref:TMEM205-like domain-containing protein n=1 Tax=Buddleja alternifolia TaxID=168488 RepID=A0AAV6YB88_9LAMI|nr:hypothetical protein BUALT_Bualt01G0002200 [Buddleja alternifolia]